MKYIKLTQGKFAIIDDEDFEQTNKFKWYALKDRNTWYAVRTIYKADGKQKTIRMHREIMKMPPGIETDHKNHNGLDNQKKNLRCATRAENGQNRCIQKRPKSSRHKGVCWCRRDGKWRAQIKLNGRQIWLGHFNSEIEAALAYDKAAKQHFGKYACINI